MRLLSLDTSTTISGFAIYDNRNLTYYSSIDLAFIKDSSRRLKEMVRNIILLITKSKPSIIIIEETAVPRNPQTQRMLTMVLGAVFGYCVMHNINYVSLRPS